MGVHRLRFFPGTVALALVLSVVLGSAGLFGPSRAFGAGTTLTILSGAVSVRHGSDAFAAAADGDVLNEGDTIRTASDARAVLTYFEGSTVTVEPNTELVIDSAATLGDGGTVVAMTQNVGRTWHVVTKLVTGSSKYEVKTPASTASVRGTEFEVRSDAAATTVSTTEGIVVARVVDPQRPGTAAEVPVTAGRTQTQPKDSAPAPARPAAESQRRVTVSVRASNTLVVDPLGRSNGLTKDGKLVAQTPGAQVRRVGDTIVITLPDLPDGRLATRVEKKDDGDQDDVEVRTTIDEDGRSVELRDSARADGSLKIAGADIARGADGRTQGRTLATDEKRDLPSARTARPAPTREPAATRGPAATSDGGGRRTEAPRASATARPPAVTDRPNATSRATVTPTPSPSSTARPTATPRPSDRAELPAPTGGRSAQSGFIPVSQSLPTLPTPSRNTQSTQRD